VFPVDEGLLLVRIGNKEGEANAKTTEGTKKPCQEGGSISYDILLGRLDDTQFNSSVVPRRSRLPSHQKRANRGWMLLFFCFRIQQHSVVRTYHPHTVCTILYASPPRKFSWMRKDCKTSVIDIMRGYNNYAMPQKPTDRSKSRTFCESRLDLPGTPLRTPTSTKGLSNGLPWNKNLPTLVKALRPARMEPPIHVEYLRSGGA
jgi:hypothetical protein